MRSLSLVFPSSTNDLPPTIFSVPPSTTSTSPSINPPKKTETWSSTSMKIHRPPIPRKKSQNPKRLKFLRKKKRKSESVVSVITKRTYAATLLRKF